MKKLLFIILLFVIPLSAQQIDFTHGTNVYGTAYTGAGYGYLDSTGTLTKDMYISFDDYYVFGGRDALTDTLSLGALSYFFDAKNSTDSVLLTIKAYPMYSAAVNDPLVSAKAGTAVTLKTLSGVIGDQNGVLDVYVDVTNRPTYPPRWVKIEIDAASSCNDSITVYLDFAMPAIHEVFKERKVN